MKNYLKGFAGLSLPLILLMTSVSAGAAGWDQKVYETSTLSETSWNELTSKVGVAELVDLGEKHLTTEVQAAQARVLRDSFSVKRSWILGWEFLNVKDQAKTAQLYSDFRAGTLDVMAFLNQALGQTGYDSYAPILEAAKSAEVDLFGLNLSREQKAPVVQGGLSALDPSLLPPGFELGDSNYFDRFVEAMGGHGSPTLINNYFAAQCLVDDVMAYQLLAAPSPGARVMVNGSFHSDYYDGAVKRLQVRAPKQSMVTVRFIDASDYQEAELLPLLKDAKYGAIADYVVFVKEPAQP